MRWAAIIALALVATDASAQMPATGGTAAQTFTVTVQEMQAPGQPVPAAGRAVRIVARTVLPPMRGGSGVPEVALDTTVETDERGVAGVALAAGKRWADVEATVEHQGATFRTGTRRPDDGPARLTLFPVTRDAGALTAEVAAELTVEEAFVHVDSWIRLQVSGDAAVPLGANAPRVPFLGFDMGGFGPLDTVVTAGSFRHLRARVRSGSLALRREPDGLALDGVVAPGEPVLVQVSYPLSHYGTVTPLALRAPFGLAALTVRLSSPERVLPTLQVATRGRRTTETDDGIYRQRFEASGPIPPGALVRATITGLPAPNPGWRRAVAVGALLLLGLFTLAWLRLARDDGAPPAEAA